jgi:hypothetical protein
MKVLMAYALVSDFFPFKRSTTSELATKTEEYVPTRIPMNRAKMKP